MWYVVLYARFIHKGTPLFGAPRTLTTTLSAALLCDSENPVKLNGN